MSGWLSDRRYRPRDLEAFRPLDYLRNIDSDVDAAHSRHIGRSWQYLTMIGNVLHVVRLDNERCRVCDKDTPALLCVSVRKLESHTARAPARAALSAMKWLPPL